VESVLDVLQDTLDGQRDLHLGSRYGPQAGLRERLHVGGSFLGLLGTRMIPCGRKEPPPSVHEFNRIWDIAIWVFDRDSGAVLLKIKQDVNTVTGQVYAPMPGSQASATGNPGSERPEPSTAVAASLNSGARAQAYDDPICGKVMPFAEAAYHAFERGLAQSDAVAHASTAAPQFSNYWRAFIEKAYGAASVEEAKAAVYSQCLAMKPN
jgi:hypothetical protein